MGSNFQSYRELKIWQKGVEITKAIYILCQSFPESEKFGLVSQLKRCAVSIPSNIAEGWGRGYQKSFESFLKISRGSLAELETQLYISLELGFIKPNDYEMLIELTTEESKMLNAFIIKLIQKEKTS
jgi:four helix bundle protein